ncbi:hypothetical protein O181_034908 [Austropuccinia psidii MF-1]|uniref:Importin N-terminal domain-containing protein n=1 Tax=Austropuccinia psidii MF-1 TaxID=1389203 RepID=A0A9Q3D6F8_9BASI|nr:hypothetical protein [Austropuccinia psidii MF-1]
MIDLDWLIDCLQKLLDPRLDNETRIQLDSKISKDLLFNQSIDLFKSLTFISINSNLSIQIRIQSLILLRNLGLKSIETSDYVWSTNLNYQIQNDLLNQLFSSLISINSCHQDHENFNQSNQLITQLGLTISQLAKYSSQFQSNPDLNHWENSIRSIFFNKLLPNQPILQTALLNILNNLPSLLSNDPNQLQSIIISCLQSDHFPLRLNALMIISTSTLQSNFSFQTTIYQSILTPLLQHPIQNEIELALNRLIEFFTLEQIDELNSWIQPILQLIQIHHHSKSIKSLALESLISLIESSPPSPEIPSLNWLESTFQSILNLMSQIDEDQNWSSNLDDDDDEDQDEIYVQAEQALDRLTQEISHTHSDQLFELILSVIQTPSPTVWQARHAILSALAAMGEGLAQSFTLNFEPIFLALKSGFEDQNPRIVYAAIYAVSQLSSPLKTTFSTNSVHHQVLTWLLGCLETESQPRLQTFASRALINVLWDGVEQKENLVNQEMAGSILVQLIALCQSSQSPLWSKVKLDALNAITKLLGSITKETALAFYDPVIQLFQSLIQQVETIRSKLNSQSIGINEEGIDELEMRVYEAIGQLAVISGQQRFEVDSIQWARQIALAQKSRFNGQSRILAALTRLSAGMNSDRFVQEGFLEILLGELLKGCQSKPDISISALLDDEHEFDDPQWESVVIGEKTFGIKSAELAEKETAVESLVVLVNQMGISLIPHYDRIVEAVIPLLKFYFSDELRESALAVLPLLLRSAKRSGMPPERLEAISTSFCQSITLALSVEPTDPGNLGFSFLIAWAECITHQPPSVEEVDRMAKVCDERLEAVILQADDEVEDEEELMRMLTGISRVLRLAIRLKPDWKWRKLIDQVIEWVANWHSMHSRIAIGLKRMGFRLIGAFVKYHMGDGGEELIGKIGQHILSGFRDKDDCIRGLAPFIVGLCAEKNGERPLGVYVELINSSIDYLVQGLQRQDDLNGKNLEAIQVARENCVSALAKIIRNSEGLAIDVDKVLPIWIMALPIEIDVEEVEPSYGLFLELIARGHEVIDPRKNDITKIEQIINSLLTVIKNESIGVECRNSLKVGLKTYLNEIPSELLNDLNHRFENEIIWKELKQFF